MRTASTSSASSAPTTTARTVATSHGPTVTVPVQFFFDHVLPPLQPGINPTDVIARVKRAGSRNHRPITRSDRWRGCPDEPASLKRPRNKTFDFLVDAVHAITKAANIKGTTRLLGFYNNPDSVQRYDKRRDDTLPDAYFSRGVPTRLSDIGVIGEYKKKDLKADRNDNTDKLIDSMTRCMQVDPRRRFVLGFTIENATMTLWFLDRVQLVISTPFNFLTDRTTLVHFVLSISYAEDHEIGWDPTIKANADSSYDISMHLDDGTRVYRALELLSDAEESLGGKGTRVWKAVLVEDGVEHGDHVVLKDCWVDNPRLSEGTITRTVRDATCPQDENNDDGRNPFLTVQCHGDVFLEHERATLDCTRSFVTKGDLLQDAGSRTGQTSSDRRNTQSRSPKCRVHYRIVFKELCVPISEETSPAVVFKALADVANALSLMHASKWVHRDLSAGNILLDSNGIGRLTDLEYAKRADDEQQGYLGTAQFIAVEVDNEMYCFLPEAERQSAPIAISDEQMAAYHEAVFNDASSDELKRIMPHLREPIAHRSRPPHLRYNPLHDMESLWWIAAYFVIKREAIADAESKLVQQPDSLKAQLAYAWTLFHGGRQRRLDTISNMVDRFSDHIGDLHPAVQPIARTLDQLRGQLLEAYQAAEKDLDKDPESIDHTAADGLHKLFALAFTRISQVKNLQGVQLRRFRSSQQEPDQKQEKSHPHSGEDSNSDADSGEDSDSDSVAAATEAPKPRAKKSAPPPKKVPARKQKPKDPPQSGRYNLRRRTSRPS